MVNKIVILDNSIQLYEHYIDDAKWERTLAFPRGGVTYLVSNGTIKFYAYEDYLYRNCLISMQLPIRVLDEKRNIDGEYEDIDDLTRVLDPIFPSNDIDAELEYYLSIADAERIYQPIGDYALKSEIPSVDGFVTDEELVDALDDYVSASTYTAFTSTTEASIQTLRGTKLDVSAYTPSDLSNYYTKSEVYSKGETYNRNEIDDKIIQSGTFDPTLYYTKGTCDTRFALKNEMPSLNGYATEEWVTSKNYSTRTDFITYINNMQQQINSLMGAVSGCCQTHEDVYRWLTIIGEYLCEGNNKYEKQKYQVSHDGGIVWEDVTPIQYQKGQLIESDSTDCGYAPQPQYRWQKADTSDYMCDGTSKYYKLYYEVSYDGGQTWQKAVPEQTKIGDLIESNSSDCGYVTPQYRWKKAASTDYVCSGTTKYYKEYYQVSYDGGKTWTNVSPEETRTSIDKIESNSVDCGYVTPPSKLVLTLNDGSTVSAACGSAPGPIGQPNETTMYDLNEYQDIAVRAEIKDCVTRIGEWSFFSYTITSVTMPNTVTSIGYCGFGHCRYLTGVTLPNSIIEMDDCAFEYCSMLTSVVMSNNLTSIGAKAFYGCINLTSITLPSSITSLGDRAFYHCLVLRTVTCKATTPPTIGDEVFGDNKKLTAIYVPSGSVNAYKAADGWKDYASIIKPINS